MKPKNKITKQVIVKNNKDSNSGHIRTDSLLDQNKNNSTKEKEMKNPKFLTNNLQSFTALVSDENRRTLMPTNPNKKSSNVSPFRQTLKKKEKEKNTILKKKINKNDKKSPKMKKMVNFTRHLMALNPHQKTDRSLKNKKDDPNMKSNKSVGNLKNDLNDSEDLGNKSIDINNDDNPASKTIQVTENNKNSILKHNKTEEKKKDEKEEKDIIINKEEQKPLQNKLEITTMKSDSPQINKEEINNEKDNIKKSENTPLNPQIVKRVIFSADKDKDKNSNEKQINKDQNSKSQKAYNNLLQNIRKSNKNSKKNLSNLLKPENPNKKMSKAVKKAIILNKSVRNTCKLDNKKKDIPQKSTNNTLIPTLRDELLNAMDDNNEHPKNISCKDVVKAIDIEKTKSIKKTQNKDNFTGLILLKFNEGEKVFEIKLNGTIENINELFNKENIKIDNKEVELICKTDLEKLRKENETYEREYFKLKDEYEKQRELLENYQNDKKIKDDQLLNAIRNKNLETENNLKEESKLKIKEIKERIQKYKDELKKNNNTLETQNDRMSCRLKTNRKEAFNIDQKMKELEKKREKLMEENKKLKQLEISNEKANNIKTYRDTKNDQNINTNINTNFFNEVKNDLNKIEKNKINPDKKQNNINKVNKDDNKDKEKAFSKALDRFKKRYRKDASMEIRSKKSEKISEIAKNLEKVMENRQQSAEIVENRKKNDIPLVQKSSEIIENQPIINKAKKPKKPQI